MQLVAYGAQDIYLTGNPQITFFKVVYRRHTNFSMEAIEQTWNGFNKAGGRCTATISRNGDLVHKMYFEITAPGTVAASADNPGVSWIKSVELEIGGQKIDKQSGVWMETWAELTESNPSGTVGDAAVAAITSTLFQKMSGMGGVSSATHTATKFFVPLQFWFCRNPGLALPLIALQYHEVKVILDHALEPIFTANAGNTMSLWCDYIYLDTDERRRFAQVSHEYLIEQVQEQTMEAAAAAATTTELNFNHPVKELVWTVRDTKVSLSTAGAVSQTLAATADDVSDGTYTLKLNGHERFAARDFSYFTRTQIWEHHSGAGGVISRTAGAGGFNDSIAVYSFALKPEEHQPSGTCNSVSYTHLTLPTNREV